MALALAPAVGVGVGLGLIHIAQAPALDKLPVITYQIEEQAVEESVRSTAVDGVAAGKEEVTKLGRQGRFFEQVVGRVGGRGRGWGGDRRLSKRCQDGRLGSCNPADCFSLRGGMDVAGGEDGVDVIVNGHVAEKLKSGVSLPSVS